VRWANGFALVITRTVLISEDGVDAD